MTEIKSKKRLARKKKLLSKKTALPLWLVEFNRLFHYWPVVEMQKFFDGFFDNAYDEGFRKGKYAGQKEESKSYAELIAGLTTISREWMKEHPNKDIKPMGLIEWKLEKEFRRGVEEGKKS